MRRLKVALLLSFGLAACGHGGEGSPDGALGDASIPRDGSARPDASTRPDAGAMASDGGPASDGGRGSDAAAPDADFHHFSFAIEPAVPLAGRDFTLLVTAHDSSDDSSVLDFDGTVSVTSSVGSLSGEVRGAGLSGGMAELTLQLDTAADDVTLTVTEEEHPSMTGTTAPFRVSPPGDSADPLDVVINEVNWFGSGADADDEWIELRNVSGAAVNLSEWTIDNAGPGDAPPVRIDNGTVLEAGAYLVLARYQGPDEEGERSSVTGVGDVQLHSLELADGGEALRLKDPSGTVIDATPDGAWPAGDAEHLLSMERRDDLTGGGYDEGSLASAWYSWSVLDGTDTTSDDTGDRGTPGADNTDPGIFDHFIIEVTPDTPVAEHDFTMTVTAYSSADDSEALAGYDGTISVTASIGTLTGETTEQSITAGMTELTLQTDTVADTVTLTVTDDVYPTITGSIDVSVRPEGDVAGPGDVYINEVNWYGNGDDSSDEWIELRNRSGGPLNLSGWVLDNAGSADGAVTLDSGTVLDDGAYLVVAEMRGSDADGERTSLTGVEGVQIQNLELANSGEQLVLRDVEGTVVDTTPAGTWPAGDADELLSMERLDDNTGGGYTDGGSADAWYTWNRFSGVDATNAATADRGTPGADNSDPFPSPIYASSFEPGDPEWENTATGGFSTSPPPGTSARTGDGVVTTDSITTSFSGRQVRSVDCIVLASDSSPLGVDIFGTASTDNGGNVLRGRVRVLFHEDADCTSLAAALGPSSSMVLPQGSYQKVSALVDPPPDATHFQIWFQVRDDNGEPNDGDDWAADDVAVYQ